MPAAAILLLLALPARSPRRAIWWVRISYAILLACAALQICFEAEIAQSLTFPMYGGARPTAHLLVIFMGFFVNYHHCFRWLTIMAQCVFIIFDTFSVAHIDLQLQCRSNGTCESTDGWSVMDLTVIQVRHYVALWFEIWTVLITAYLMFVIGICWPRYPVRMFSSSQPLSVLPGGRTQYGKCTSNAPWPPPSAQAGTLLPRSFLLLAQGVFMLRTPNWTQSEWGLGDKLHAPPLLGSPGTKEFARTFISSATWWLGVD